MSKLISRVLYLVFSLSLINAPALQAEENQDLSALFGSKAEFLDVDDAFKPDVEIVDQEIIVKFEIADKYYLYRGRFMFDAKGATLGKAYIPDGKKKVDEYLGEVEVYHHNLEISIPYTAQNKQFEFILEYQGCAEAGLCYPPEEKTFALTATKVASSSAANPNGNGKSASAESTKSIPVVQSTKSTPAKTAKEFVPEQQAISNFLVDKSLLEIVGYMVLLGIFLAFTPCVLPMVPILSSIIVGQGKEVTTRKSFILSLTYTQSMAIPFAALGLIVGGAGETLGLDINSNTFQSPWFVIPAAIIFVLLSLSMFGFYELQLPAGMRNKLSNLSNDQQGGTLVGAGIMGVLSALVVSPCVTVPVAAVLIYIAQTGDMVIGGVALYSLAVGMGIPLLLVGVGGGKLLPKAGGWMNAVKAAFGVGMLAMALYITKHLIPGTLNMVLWAILLIVTATYMGALSAVQSNAAKLWKGVGLVIFAYGLLLLIGASMGNGQLLKPLKGLSLSSSSMMQNNSITASNQMAEPGVHFIRVKTIADVDQYLAQAKAQGKTVMFDFFAVSCTACYEFEELVFPDPAVVAALSNTILIQADVTDNDSQDKALMKHFGVKALPSILFFDKNGFEDKRLRAIGLEEADVFVQRIEAAFTVNL